MVKTPARSCVEENREALKARASLLLATGEAAEETHSLDNVWPDGNPPLAELSRRQEVVWQECLAVFGHCNSPAMITANHFLNVIQLGFDANRVPYPHKMLRAGYPKPMTWSASVNAINGNDLTFVLSGVIGRDSDPEWLEGSEQELGKRWQMDLAKSADELRASVRADSDALDTTLVSWPMFPLNLLAGDVPDQLVNDPQLFQDHRHLRARMHNDLPEFDVSLDALRSLPENIVADDICIDSQLRLLEARARRGPLSNTQLARRRVNINSRFFEEVFPALEKEAAFAEMRARWAHDKATEAREYDLAAEYGAQFVAWPVENELRWPKLSRVWVQHARWFEMWRRSQKTLQSHQLSNATKNKKVSKEANCADSEASWDALSECSDSSWQAVSELSTTSWQDLARECGSMEKNVDVSEMLQELRDSQDISSLESEVAAITADCEKDLAAAFPALRSAVESLSMLCKADVTEVRAMKAPPAGVVLVARALCIMFEVKPVKAPEALKHRWDYWEPAKKCLLADPRLLDRMLNFDKDNISDAVMAKITPIFENPLFEPDMIKKASVAASGICKWVRGMVIYGSVAKRVAPKKLKLVAAVKALAEAEAALATKQENALEMIAQSEEEVEIEADIALQLKAEAEAELLTAEAKLAMEGARAALDCLSKSCIQELKCLSKPPSEVADVCAVAGLLLGKKIVDWTGAQRMMSNPAQFIDEMKACSATSIPKAVLKQCQPIVERDFFTFEAMKSKSIAAAHLANWLVNVIAFNRINEKVATLMAIIPTPTRTVASSTLGVDNGFEFQKEKEQRELARQQRKEASDRKIIERLKASLERAQQPIHRKVGKQEKEGWAYPFRSPPVWQARRVGQDPTGGIEATHPNCDRNDPMPFKADIQELKSLANPPEMVKRTLMALFILLGQEPTGWKEVRLQLCDSKLLSKLEEFDASSVDLAILTKLEPYVSDPCFNAESVCQVSAAAVGLCKWIRGIMDASKLTPMPDQKTKSPQDIECSDFLLVSSTASPTSTISPAFSASINPAITCEHQLVREEEHCV